jgi:predicted neuraminidase
MHATLWLVCVTCWIPTAVASPALVRSEFVFESAPFPSCHASTIAEPAGGQLVAAWFGGARESAPDVGIWLARREAGHWTTPQLVANGVQADGTRYPCWNPVLFQPQHGPLMLFYKVGPSPSRWWGMLRTSADGGKRWSPARRLPAGILGPIKNKPVQLADGTILCPTSTEHDGWRVHFERSTDGGQTWTATAAVAADPRKIGAIQPSILVHGTRLQAVGRTQNKQLFSTWSDDGGKQWTPLALLAVPNPNSGTDAVTLREGRHLLVYNHTPRGRSPLNVALSDDGQTWQTVLTLEDEAGAEFSYPACIQTRDGLVHITYTWKRQRVKHVVLDPARLVVHTPQRSPITNAVEWKNGKPVGLPGVARPKVQSTFLYRPEREWTYSHHASLTFFQGRWYAIWSNGRQNEDDRGQRVLLATSDDFAHWSESRVLVDSVRDRKGQERVLTAAGFHQHGGTLVAYFGNYGYHKEGTRLQAVTTRDGQQWSKVREVGLPVNPNHGPQAIASGRLIISGNISFPWSDDPSGLAGWHMSGLYPASRQATIKDDPESFWDVAGWRGWWPVALCEGSFYQTDDSVLHMLLRNGQGDYYRYRLWLSESRDNGQTWSAPLETDFSDTNAKFHFGRLPDGRFYYVGNPIGANRTPLVLSLSRDGVHFDRHFILGEEHYAARRPGLYKGGEYGYPHSVVRDGHLHVIVSRQKEAVEVLRVALAELGPR